MQNSDNNKNTRGKSSFGVHVCPQCGSVKPRRSSRHSRDGSLRKLFCKCYRCPECQNRFWEINPIRLIELAGFLLVLIPVFGVLWMAYNQQAVTYNSTEQTSRDQTMSLAEKGDAEAELKMALRYTSNARGIKDNKIAAHWFEKAARNGQVEAQYRYGLALQTGQGVVQNFKEGFYWLEKAARQGYAEAQFAVGEIYHSSNVIKSDPEQAYLWFNLAAAQGLDKAASARDLAGALLTPTQLLTMQEEARRISNSIQSAPVASKAKVEVPKSYQENEDDEPMSPVKKSILNVFNR